LSHSENHFFRLDGPQDLKSMEQRFDPIIDIANFPTRVVGSILHGI
jgi:hypothetical protein